MMYAVCMYSERLQLLLTPEQKRRLEEEALRQGTSVAQVIRAALDAHYGTVSRRSREEAARRLTERGAEFLAFDEIEAELETRFELAAEPHQ